MNGVYLGSSNLAIARMFDLARIEILKGPQGTLYGRNATGGSINIIPAAPETVFSAGIEASWGSFETARIQGHLNLPFEKSSLRLASIVSSGDGFIHNSVDKRRSAEKDFQGLRVAYRAVPYERLEIDVMAQRVEDVGATGELWLPRPDFLPDPSDIRLTTVTLAKPFLETVNDNASVGIEYDLGFATLHSVTGYARSEVRGVDDCAGLPILAGCIRSVMPSLHEQASQELRLASPGGSRVDWLVGAYYYDADESRDYFQLTPVIDPEPTDDSFSTYGETTIAVFGQATLQLGDRWSVAGGLRLSNEQRRLASIGTGSDNLPTGVRADESWANDSWRLDAAYSLTDESLVYASVSTGFKSGGMDVLAGGIVDDYDPEQLVAYEAGVKYRRPDRRLSLQWAAFFYDFQDLQVSTSTITDSGLIFETDNAARAEIYGIDTEGALQLAGRVSVTAGVVWLPKRDFVEYRNDRIGDTLSGNRLTRAPEWTATTALDYRHPLPGGGTLSARLEYDYRSDYFYTIDNDSRFAQASFGLLNLYLRFEAASQEWYAFLAGRNLGNEDYFTQVFLQASPGYPDTFEAGFGRRF
jgi:iron complex outermembrane receptor protein